MTIMLQPGGKQGYVPRSLRVSLLFSVALSIALALSGRGAPIRAQDQGATPATARITQRTDYAGDAACAPCHKEQALSYVHTSHHLTSAPADKSTVLGSFASGSNLLLISNPPSSSEAPRLSFIMEEKPDGLHQTAVAELGTKRLEHPERFDIVFGSGVRGQTYLYWKVDQLFELPVSYWTDGRRWINSPGYTDGTANFERHVDPRCVECHADYIHALSDDPQTNRFDRASFVPGIGCETCHGPGVSHIAQQQQRPARVPAIPSWGILNPARFNRDRQVDQCALCHNGTLRQELAPAFSYLPGQPLDKYLAADPMVTVDHADVHGNQVGLLKRSRCYVASPDMSCSTCHDVHAPEQAAASYSPRCLSCHRWQQCGASKAMGETIVKNCIDCHMPVQETSAIVSVTAGNVVRASIRSHWIKVYPGKESQH